MRYPTPGDMLRSAEYLSNTYVKEHTAVEIVSESAPNASMAAA